MNILLELKKSYLFSSLSRNILWQIASLCEEKNFSPGDYLIEQGTPGKNAFVIVSGEVEVFYVIDSDKKVILGHAGPGDLLGELSLIDNLPRSASNVALTPVCTLVLGAWDFQAQLQAFPEIALQLLPILAKRLRQAQSQIIKSGSQSS